MFDIRKYSIISVNLNVVDVMFDKSKVDEGKLC